MTHASVRACVCFKNYTTYVLVCVCWGEGGGGGQRQRVEHKVLLRQNHTVQQQKIYDVKKEEKKKKKKKEEEERNKVVLYRLIKIDLFSKTMCFDLAMSLLYTLSDNTQSRRYFTVHCTF